MNPPPPVCLNVTVLTFRGDRTRSYTSRFLKRLVDAKAGHGPSPSTQDCLIYAGHTGVSIDGGRTIFGFNPDGGGLAGWAVIEALKAGDAFPGVVRDDTAVFTAARLHPLAVLTFDVRLPDAAFRAFETVLDGERRTSQYSYGFPDGDGECNCTTWLERMGLPLLSGWMDEFAGLPGFVKYPTRRFGVCT